MTKISKLEQLTEEEYKKIVSSLKDEYLESWMTLREFSDKYNIQVPVINEILKQEGLVKDRKKWNISKNPETIKKIKATKLERYGDPGYNNIEKNKRNRLAKFNGQYFSPEGAKNFKKPLSSEAKEKARQTCLKNHGVDNIFKKKDYIQQKTKEKYGVHNVSKLQEVKDKKKATFQEHYGVDCGFQAEEIKEKSKKTCLERYGVDNANKSPIIQEKSKKTKIAKGFQWDESNLDIFFNTWTKKRKPTVKDFQIFLNCSDLSNVYKVVDRHGIRNKFDIHVSFLEMEVQEFLEKHNINFEKHNRQLIKPLELDFYLPEYNVALEVNDIWSHNSTKGGFGYDPLPIDYHFKKTMLCRDKGIRLIHLFEPYIMIAKKWRILEDIILQACHKNKRVYARKLDIEIKPAIEMKQFFEDNNIQEYRNAETAFVLINKETREPMMCYTVGRAWFGKGKYDAEIARGACKLGYSIVGGASKLWKHIINYYKDKDLYGNPGSINSIVYYVDLNHYNGQSMTFLDGVQFIKEQYGFWNYWVKEGILKNREPGRHQEIKQLEKEGKVLVIGNSGT